MARYGDVYSINASRGKAYLHYVCKMPPMGTLIRVLPGIHSEPPKVMGDLVAEWTNFWIFFPISAAENKGIIERVANFALPEHSKTPPLFRAGNRDPLTGKVVDWWFWDGEKEWRVGAITEDQRKLPIRGAWNDTMLIKRIEEGWLPEKDSR